MLVWATHLGYHVGEEPQRLDHLVLSLTWTCGSLDLHTAFQPTCCVCDERPWQAVNHTRSYSGCIWSPMIVATVSGRWVALSQHLDACCEWRATCCNFLPVAESMKIAPKLELNTVQKKKRTSGTTLCIGTDGSLWSVAWMCTHHWRFTICQWMKTTNSLFHNLNEKTTVIQPITHKIV